MIGGMTAAIKANEGWRFTVHITAEARNKDEPRDTQDVC
jgi:hypothetical protein